MTTDRDSQLEEARHEAAQARIRYETAVVRKWKREAAEDLEYWTNKAALLANAK